MGRGLTPRQKRYYKNKALRKLQKQVGGTIKGGQLVLKSGWVEPTWLVASNMETALDLKIVRRKGKVSKYGFQSGTVKARASDFYWNKQSYLKEIRKLKK